MAALTTERDTKHREHSRLRSLPVAASTTIYAGSLVCVNAAGYAVPGSTATTLQAVGRAEKTVDNSAGVAGAKNVDVVSGIFKFGNSSSGDAIAIANRFDTVYIVDDQTVALTNGSSTRSVAGMVEDVESDGVWVDINPIR
jgi:hypothetical protein